MTDQTQPDTRADICAAVLGGNAGPVLKLIKQRDELLAACHAAEAELEYVEAATGFPCHETAIEIIRAAIERCKP